MILEMLLAEYAGITIFNTVVPIIKKERARKNREKCLKIMDMM